MATRVLVIYGTTQGQTAKVARAIADAMQSADREVDLVDASTRRTQPRADDYTAVIVAASVHAGGYQRPVVRWVKKNLAGLRGRPTAFVSVCLGVLQHDPKVDRELQNILERFYAATGWRPGEAKIVAGALPYTKYNWVTRHVMRRIAQQAHGDTDTTRDFEYTDWNDVAVFARRFASNLATRADTRLPIAG